MFIRFYLLQILFRYLSLSLSPSAHFSSEHGIASEVKLACYIDNLDVYEDCSQHWTSRPISLICASLWTNKGRHNFYNQNILLYIELVHLYAQIADVDVAASAATAAVVVLVVV